MVYRISYKQWVIEGNNYAGFSGYRDFEKTFWDGRDAERFLERASEDTNKIVIKEIAFYNVSNPEFVSVEEALDEAKNRIITRKKEEKKKRLEKEIAERQKALGELK